MSFPGDFDKAFLATVDTAHSDGDVDHASDTDSEDKDRATRGDRVIRGIMQSAFWFVLWYALTSGDFGYAGPLNALLGLALLHPLASITMIDAPVLAVGGEVDGPNVMYNEISVTTAVMRMLRNSVVDFWRATQHSAVTAHKDDPRTLGTKVRVDFTFGHEAHPTAYLLSNTDTPRIIVIRLFGQLVGLVIARFILRTGMIYSRLAILVTIVDTALAFLTARHVYRVHYTARGDGQGTERYWTYDRTSLRAVLIEKVYSPAVSAIKWYVIEKVYPPRPIVPTEDIVASLGAAMNSAPL